ncbi:hypothetical protein [Photobacterium nomapromontoriensis]|uniref:hypothetical protein n=1 Tax=Photobacterium nomapromontoriensis TaxID=2910237 RepID=UPI003D09F8FE
MMHISYLKNSCWSDWTREERFFCSSLYEQAKQRLGEFIALINLKTDLALDEDIEWDIGYEVCFYRDYLWQKNTLPIKSSKYSSKRTFDLCLFSEDTIVIIEAKVFSLFEREDGEKLAKDKKHLPEILNRPNLRVLTLALASSVYFNNHAKFGAPEILQPYDAKLTWLSLFENYGNKLFGTADRLYKSKPRYI